MAGSSSEHIMKFIADFSQVGPALAALNAEAKAAASKAIVIPEGQHRTPRQRQDALAVEQGRQRAAVTHAHDTGVFGPKGDPETARKLKQVQQEQNRIFRTAREDAGLPKPTGQRNDELNALTNRAKAETLALYERATTEAQKQLIFQGETTQATRNILKSERNRGIITDKAYKAALKELAAQEKLAKQAATEAAKPAKKAPAKKAPAKKVVPEPVVVDQSQLDTDAGAAAAAEAAAEAPPKKKAPRKRAPKKVVPADSLLADTFDTSALAPSKIEDSFFGPEYAAAKEQRLAAAQALAEAEKEMLAAETAVGEKGGLARLQSADAKVDLAQADLTLAKQAEERVDEAFVANEAWKAEQLKALQATKAKTVAEEAGAKVAQDGVAEQVATKPKRKPRTKAASPPPPPPPPVLPADPGFFDDDMSDEEIDAALQAQADANFAGAKAAEANAEATAEVAAADKEVAASKKKRANSKKGKERERTAAQIKEDESLVVRVSPEEVAARTDPRNVGKGASAKELNAAEIEASKATSRALAKQRAKAKEAADEAAASIPIISSGKLEPGESAADRKAKVEAARVRATELRAIQDEIEEKQREQRNFRARRKAAEAREFRLSPEGKAAAAAAYNESPEAKASAARREAIVSRTPAAELVAQQKAEEKERLKQREIEDARTVAKAQLLAEEKADGKVQRELTEEEIQARIKTVQAERERARLAGVLTADQAKRLLEDAESPRPTSFQPSTKDQDAAKVARDKVLRQRAAIAADDVLLGNEVRDTSDLSYKDGLKVRAAQQAQARAIARETAATQASAAHQEKLLVEAELADKVGLQATIDLAAAKRKLSAVISLGVEQTLQADSQYVTAVREAAAVKQKGVLAELKYQATSGFVEQEAAINVQRAANDQKRLSTEYTLLKADEAGLKQAAQTVILKEQYNRLLQAEIKAQAKAAGLQKGGLLNRIKGYAYGGGGGGGGGGFDGGGGFGGDTSGGQFLAQGGLSTLKHAIPSLLLFGAAAGILVSVKAAEDLERELALVEAQFIATDQAGDFPVFRQRILDIARETGVAADVVAHLGLQIQGAFGEGTGANIDGLEGLGLVQDQLAAAAQIAQVTGLDPKEIVDSLTAASFAFDESFTRIGDVTLSLQDRFGVLAKEIIPSLGDIAPVAAQAGFSLEEFGTIAAAAQQRSGRSGTVLIENFNRIIPAVVEAKEELVGLAQNVEALRTPEFLEAVGRGDVKTQLLEIARVYSQLNQPQKDQITQLLGGERNAGALIAALANSDELLGQINDTQEDTNALAEHWVDLQDTLAIKLDKLKEQAKQLGVALFEAGVGDVLKLLVNGFGDVADLVVNLLGLFSSFNQALGGIPSKLLAVLAVLKLIQITNNKLNLGAATGRLVTGVQNTVGGFNGGFGLGARSGVRAFEQGVAAQGYQRTPTARDRLNANGGTAYAAAALSLVQLQQTREGVGADLSSQGQQIQELLQEQTEEEVAAFVEQRQSFSDQIQTDGYSAFFGAWVSGAKTLRQQGIDAQQQQRQGELLAALNAVKEAGVVGGSTQSTTGISFAGIGFDPNDALGKIFGVTDPLGTDVEASAEEANAELDKLIADFTADPTNDQTFNAVISYLANTAALSDAQKENIEKAIANYKAEADALDEENKRNEEQAQRLEESKLSLEELKVRYDIGAASFTALKDAYREYSVLLADTAAAGTDPELALAAIKAQAEEQKFVSEAIRSANDFALTLSQATGDGGTEQDQIAGLIATLNNTEFLDSASRRQAALDLLDLERELLNKEAEAANTAAESLAILTRGRDVPVVARIELITSQLKTDPTFDEFAHGLADKSGAILDGITDDVAAVMVLTGDSVQEATIAVIDAAIQNIKEKLKAAGLDKKGQQDDTLLGLLEGLQAARRDAQGSLSGANIVDPATVRGSADDVEAAQEQVEEEARALADARSALFNAIHAGDPVALAQQAIRDADRAYAEAKTDADRINAQAARVSAQRDLEEAYNAISDARNDLVLAGIENDPLAVARNAQQEADRQYARARGEAERISAQAARIRADRAVADAIQDIYASQADLLQAMFEYGGNTVQSARLGLKTAKDRLAYLQSTGAGDAEINRAKGDVITAQGGLRDARLDRKLQDYAFLYDMDKINKQQYIAYLMQLKEIPDLTTQQLRDLDRQIKSLRDELGADFQFNLPTTLGLPTLYEVRRANQTPGGGGSYQDMRNYNIVLYVNNGMDQAAAEQFLSEAMGTNRVSTGTRRY